MLIYLVTLGMLVSSQAAMAQTPSAPSSSVSAGDLKQILLRYQGISSLDVDFQQLKTLKEMKTPLRSKGHLTVHPPDAVTYKLTSPAALTVVLNSRSITIESGSGDEKTTQVLNVNALKGSKEHRNLQAMISWLEMNPSDLAKNYQITRLDAHTFHFVPLKSGEAPFTSLDLVVSPLGDVTNLTMNETSGDKIEFLFGPPKIMRKK